MKKAALGLLISGLLGFSQAQECAYYTVKKGDTYERIAKAFGIKTETLIQANKGKKVLRVGDKVCIPSLSAKSEGSYDVYVVKKGGRLSDVAKHTGVPLKELERLNPDLKNGFLKAGTKVKVPKGTLAKKSSTWEVKYETYKVQKSGARLEHVAKKTGVPLAELERLNPELKGKTLKAGTIVKIPVREYAVKEQVKRQEVDIYVVQKNGARLSDVAKRVGVPLSTLEDLNPELKGKLLSKGTQVRIPKRAEEELKVVYKVHRVRKGETLHSISKLYGVRVEDIKSVNKLKSTHLQAGQSIKVPIVVAQSKPKAEEEPMEKVSRREEIKVIPPPEKETETQVKLSKESIIMPVDGKVVQSGRGVDIISRCGEEVKSVDDGRVIYSGGDLQAYGNMVIVEHGSFMSIYAYNLENLVRRGDRVQKGQTIAKVGTKPGENQCMLKFELRSKDGAPINPMEYLVGNH